MRRKLLIFSFWLPTTVITVTATALMLLSINTKSVPKTALGGEIINYGINEYQLFAAIPEVLGSFTSTVETGDARGEILRKFFDKHKSPLSSHSEYLVQIADTYNLDFRLLPAIAMQESNLCKIIPDNSYNCWGFGIYGDKVTRFDSYEQAAEMVAKTIRSSYVDKGLISPEEIMAKYTPSSNGSWANAVNHFMEQMR